MAQVPYQPIPTVAPTEQGIPTPRVNAPLEAFGGATGAALSRLGATSDHAGNEIFARAVAMQQLDNESEAKAADADYMMKAGKLHADYSSLEGKTAVDAYPKYTKDLNELRTNMRDGLSNDMARKMFDGSSLSTMGRTIFNGAGHAASENKKYVGGASVARIAAAKDFVMQNPQDEGAFEQGNRTIDAEVNGTQAHLEGWSPEKTAEEAAKHKSQLISMRVEGMAKTQPWTAKEYFDQNRSKMVAQDIQRTDKLVESSTRTAGSRIIADKTDEHFGTDADGIVGSLKDRIDYAKAEAAKSAPDDPLMPAYAEQAVIANFNRAKAVKRDFDIDNINTVNGAMIGGSTQGGKLPTSIVELTADPKVAKAWNDLDQTKQRSFLSALAKNARGDQAWTAESQKRYLGLKGLAQEDPREFMGVDVMNENLPFSAKRELVSQQIKLKGQAESDPRVTHAMQVLRPMTQAAGITIADKDQYYQFVGAMQDALDQFQKDNKKLPKAEDIQLMGARLLQQQQGGGWFGSNVGAPQMFAIPVPEAVANRIKNDPFWAERNVVPDAETIRRIYAREQYQKLYGGSKASDKPQVPKQ